MFGGTFDPVHNGHLRIALDALETLGLAEVRLVPLGGAVHREQPRTPAPLRLAMLQAAVRGHAGLTVDDRELRRGGPSYTVDTLQSLRADLPQRDLCLLLGGDAFNGFASWRDPEGILALANLAILERPGHRLSDEPALQDLWSRHAVERLRPGRAGQIVRCPVTQLAIAASDIRRRLASGRRADFLVPDPVLALIQKHDLYHAKMPSPGGQNGPVGL